MEEKSIAAYENWAEEAGDPEVAGVCRKIADIEKFHKTLLENTMQYLERTIDWFMQEERWSFDGG